VRPCRRRPERRTVRIFAAARGGQIKIFAAAGDGENVIVGGDLYLQTQLKTYSTVNPRCPRFNGRVRIASTLYDAASLPARGQLGRRSFLFAARSGAKSLPRNLSEIGGR
jgi:hypothetical protein